MSNTIKPGEVTTPKIASYAVTESKLANNAVTTDKIADGAVKTAKIGDKQVTGDKIADRSISTTKIIDGAITGIKIADGTITKDKISDGVLGRPLTPPVASVEIADNAVSETKIQNNAVTADKIKASAVTVDKLATNSVTKVKLASNSVGYLEIINGSVEPRHIRAVDTPLNGEVPSYNQLQERFEWIAPGGGGVSRPLVPPVATGEIAIGAVDGERLAVGAVTKAKLSYKVVSVTVPIGAIGRTEPPAGDPDLVGGVILGYSVPVNQDQLIKQLVLLPNGAVSITLDKSASADNTFDVCVLRP